MDIRTERGMERRMQPEEGQIEGGGPRDPGERGCGRLERGWGYEGRMAEKGPVSPLLQAL